RAPGRAVEGERLIGASFAESLHELSAGGAPRPALQGTRDPRGPVRVRARPGDSPEGSQEEIGVDVVLDRRPRDLARVIDLADVFVRGFVADRAVSAEHEPIARIARAIDLPLQQIPGGPVG